MFVYFCFCVTKLARSSWPDLTSTTTTSILTSSLSAATLVTDRHQVWDLSYMALLEHVQYKSYSDSMLATTSRCLLHKLFRDTHKVLTQCWHLEVLTQCWHLESPRNGLSNSVFGHVHLNALSTLWLWYVAVTTAPLRLRRYLCWRVARYCS